MRSITSTRKPIKIWTAIAATLRGPRLFYDGRRVSAHDGEAITVTKNFEAAIPNIPGRSLITVEVNFAPGASAAPHNHAKSTFIYDVISGAIESKVNEREVYPSGRRELV